MPNLREFIHKRSRTIIDSNGRPVRVLEDAQAFELAAEYECGLHDVYVAALNTGITPCRYARNRDIISLADQLSLAKAQVAVVGAGGLGGHVILLLARLGVGHLVVVDPDDFDETNLNRQALASQTTLGRPKVAVAADVLAHVNPGVMLSGHQVRLDLSNGFEILSGSDVVVDGLDNVADRLVLEALTQDMGIPLVHAALGGLEGQLMTIFPGDLGLKRLYGSAADVGEGCASPESIWGVPVLVPALMGAFQAMEVVKIILNRGEVFRNVLVHVDLESGHVNAFTL